MRKENKLMSQIKDKKELIKDQLEKMNKEKRTMDDQRSRDEQECALKNEKIGTRNMLRPQYSLDETLNVQREVDMPPSTLFMGLGWDENAGDNTKHYRRFYPDELENCAQTPVPFMEYNIKKG